MGQITYLIFCKEDERKKMTYNKTILAQLNKKIVIDMIRTQGPINKAEIARKAGLSIPTVMKITDEFEKHNLIRNIGKGESTGGKRPDLLEFIYDAYYIVGVDIGRHSVKIIMMDMASNIAMQKSYPTLDKDVENPELFLDKIANYIDYIIQESGIERKLIMGIGISVPGILDYNKGKILFSVDLQWNDVEIKEVFEKKFSCWIIVENSYKALAMGEYTYGVSQGTENSFYIHLGYRIGAAIIENGKILYGKNGGSGEFGHMIMESEGPICDCGNRGCLEAVASGNAIAKKLGVSEAKLVFDAARQGDTVSKKMILEAVEYWGIAISSIVNLLDPEMIVLAGGLTKSKDLFLNPLMEVIQNYEMKYAGQNLKVKFSELGDYGTAIGVAAMFMDAFIENGGECQSR